MQASFELTPDELNADFLGKQKLAINITNSSDSGLSGISFEEACTKVARAKDSLDQEETAQSVNEALAELRAHAETIQS